MRKVLIFNAGYMPAQTYGGPVVSISNMINLLRNDFKFTVVTSSLELDGVTKLKGIIPNRINSIGKNEDVLYLDKGHYNPKYIMEIISQTSEIELIYVNSFFYAKQLYNAMKISKEIQVPILIAPRGELEENAFSLKKYKKKPFTDLFKLITKKNENIWFHSTNIEETINIQHKLNLKEDRIIELNNIPTLPNETKKSVNTLKKVNELKIIFLSRIQTKKNLKFALECLKEIDSNINASLDIFGPIENIDYWEECKNIISSFPINVKAEYKGIVNHESIFATFSNYDLFFFPTLSENFGHVIIESLQTGTPVLISNQTPWNDVDIFDAGSAIPLENKFGFVSFINNIALIDDKGMKKIRDNAQEYAKQKLDLDNLKKEYLKYLKEIML